jgi:predicted S18 family serine protease
MKIILVSLLLVSVASPAFAQSKKISHRATAVEQLKRHPALVLAPFTIAPSNENWDQTFDKPKDQNSGG